MLQQNRLILFLTIVFLHYFGINSIDEGNVNPCKRAKIVENACNIKLHSDEDKKNREKEIINSIPNFYDPPKRVRPKK